MSTQIRLGSADYELVDVKEQLTVADSFVVRSNKIGKGSGEAKLYVGQRGVDNTSFWGEEPFICNCFLLKQDLLRYLDQVHAEYLYPGQSYQGKDSFPSLWSQRRKELEHLPEQLPFELRSQTQITGPRLYVSSVTKRGAAYNIIRELSLPNITYLSVLKLFDKKTQGICYYLRLFVDFEGGDIHPAILEQAEQAIVNSQSTEKQQLVRSRQGQGLYRKHLLEECPFCPVTMVSDDRLLIASHIKPWAVSTDQERLDPKNGLMLTPTIDRLFDQGYLSFSEQKQAILSPFLSPRTYIQLGLSNGKVYPQLPLKGRELYLEYHRDNILKR